MRAGGTQGTGIEEKKIPRLLLVRPCLYALVPNQSESGRALLVRARPAVGETAATAHRTHKQNEARRARNSTLTLETRGRHDHTEHSTSSRAVDRGLPPPIRPLSGYTTRTPDALSPRESPSLQG